MFRVLALLLLAARRSTAQLTGSRGVITLPENFEYRDELTRVASQAAAAFAKRYQPSLVREAQLNQQISRNGRSFFDREVVFIGTNGQRPAIGGGNNDNFFHGESRVIRPPPENAQRIDNEHPCGNIRSQCDVPEQLLAEALLKKVQSPANSDGLVNELEGVEPLTDVNLSGGIRQGQGTNPAVGSTTGSFTSFGTSLQRNQAFTTFGQQQAGGQTNQAFTVFGQALASSSSTPNTASFTSFGQSQPSSRGIQGASFTTFGVVGSPPVSSPLKSIFGGQQFTLGGPQPSSPPATPLGSVLGGQQSTLVGLQPSSLGSSFAGQQPVTQGLTVAQNPVSSSPNSFINFG